MSSGDHSRLVSPVMFDIVYDVARYLLISFGNLCSNPKALESVILVQLGYFEMFQILPLGISFSLVNHYGFVMVAWHLETMFIAWLVSIVLESDLVYHSYDDLDPCSVALQPSPPRKFK